VIRWLSQAFCIVKSVRFLTDGTATANNKLGARPENEACAYLQNFFTAQAHETRYENTSEDRENLNF